MATPMSPDQIRASLKKWNISFLEHVGWETHNRNSHGVFGPINGLLMHHTGSSDSASHAAEERVLWDGRSDLPGPLCHFTIRDDGTVMLISSGRANHAGMGSSTTLHHVINEDYDMATTLHPGSDDIDGNIHYMGVEVQYSGSTPPTAVQYQSMVHLGAAVCDHYGWSAKSVTSHKEHTRRKSDPGHVDMGKLRKDVQALLDSK